MDFLELFFLRYYQYLKQIEKGAIHQTHRNRLHAYLLPVGRRAIEKRIKKELGETELDVTIGPRVDIKSLVDVHLTGTATITHKLPDGNPHYGEKRDVGIKLGFWELLIPNARSIFHLTFRTFLISEYILPLIISLVPLFYLLYVSVRAL